MKTSKRILLNAEPFGFGPAAAIAAIFPHLRSEVSSIGYVGTGLTLDLQSSLPYDRVHDLAKESLPAIFSQYDVFVTAMDFEMAERAKDAGLTVVIYDALAWYWPSILPVIRRADGYIAQNFFGVEERITSQPAAFRAAVVVPPIVSKGTSERTGDHVLLNLGGLQNPFWSKDDAVAYARGIITAVRAVVPNEQKLVIATSSGVAEMLGDPAVRTYGRAEAMELLQGATCAFMTPGLGNIFDAAYYGLPTVWLPPANDSQGQQLETIKSYGCADASVGWPVPIDYAGAQTDVLDLIAKATRSMDPGALAASLSSGYEAVCRMKLGRARTLIDRFGSGGAEAAAAHILSYA